jgi:protein SCO1
MVQHPGRAVLAALGILSLCGGLAAAKWLASCDATSPVAIVEAGSIGDPAPPAALLSLPAAGSYSLPVVQPAGNGWVLDGSLLPRRLSSYTTGAITLLSFIYTYCTDPVGCPLAYRTMDELKGKIERDPALHGKVRLVSVSFDPTNDTPEVMRLYGGDAARRTPWMQWAFLTTYSTGFLKPILDAYGQEIDTELDDAGVPSRVINHMLKAFLIDEYGDVREIYSTAYMDAELIYRDFKTLAQRSQGR